MYISYAYYLNFLNFVDMYYMCLYINICTYIYCKTSLNRPTMGPTLSGHFKEVFIRFRELEYQYNGIVKVMVWDPNK